MRNETWQEQERRIEADRERTGVTPVRVGHVPQWLKQRILWAIREGRLTRPHKYIRRTAWDMLQLAAREIGSDFTSTWLDHFGTTHYEGCDCFVSEPYLAPSHLKAAKRFAEVLVLRWKVDERSWWYPARTTRFVFYRPEGK